MSPLPAPEDATAAIKEGNAYPVPMEAEADWCPNKEAAATTAEG